MVTIPVPWKVISAPNAREHWRVRQRRAKAERAEGRAVLMESQGWRPDWHDPRFALVVTLTRIAPRQLDDDNLAGGFKSFRDGIADALGIKDNDRRVTWRYAQERGKPHEYAARITITPRTEEE